MRVLSLFDGIGCARIALDRAGIHVHKYYSSEIDKNAIKILNNNYSDIINLGSVTEITEEQLKEIGDIDLLIGGSPCQDLSRMKAEKGKGLDGDKSSLYYEYLRVLNFVKPKYFILENVMMKREWEDGITNDLGVESIKIDSSLVCAAHRRRNYWTNIKGVEQPQDKGLLLIDILEEAQNVPLKYWLNVDFEYKGDDAKIQCILKKDSWFRMLKEVHNVKSKCNTLLCSVGGCSQRKVYQDGQCRKLMPMEYERLQTVPDGYTYGVADTHRYKALGNGFTVDVIAHILSFIL
jgi:DNA (cytosine-5)-methyltransferase 3A